MANGPIVTSTGSKAGNGNVRNGIEGPANVKALMQSGTRRSQGAQARSVPASNELPISGLPEIGRLLLRALVAGSCGAMGRSPLLGAQTPPFSPETPMTQTNNRFFDEA